MTCSLFHGDGTDFEALVHIVNLLISNVVCSFIMAPTVIKGKEVADFRVSCTSHLLVH